MDLILSAFIIFSVLAILIISTESLIKKQIASSSSEHDKTIYPEKFSPTLTDESHIFYPPTEYHSVTRI